MINFFQNIAKVFQKSADIRKKECFDYD